MKVSTDICVWICVCIRLVSEASSELCLTAIYVGVPHTTTALPSWLIFDLIRDGSPVCDLCTEPGPRTPSAGSLDGPPWF